MSALIKCLFPVVLLTLVSCQSEPPELRILVDYQARIKRLLDIDDNREKVTDDSVLIPINYPESRALKRPVKSISIGWRDFFASLDCPSMQTLIGQRNTVAGKHPDDAVALLYELQLKHAWHHCRVKANQFSNQLPEKPPKNSSEKLPDKLKLQLNKKLTQFDREVWNRTWAGNYWQTLFSNNRNRDEFNQSSVLKVISAMRQIRRAVQVKPEKNVNRNELYSAFKTIEQSKGRLGQLIFLITEHDRVLRQTNRLLTLRVDSICPQNIKTRQAEYLARVLNKFYLSKVQRQQNKLIESFQQLKTELLQWQPFFPNKKSMQNDHFNHWQQWLYSVTGSTDRAGADQIGFGEELGKGLDKRLVDTIKQHVVIWQKLANQCRLNLTPKA